MYLYIIFFYILNKEKYEQIKNITCLLNCTYDSLFKTKTNNLTIKIIIKS